MLTPKVSFGCIRFEELPQATVGGDQVLKLTAAMRAKGYWYPCDNSFKLGQQQCRHFQIILLTRMIEGGQYLVANSPLTRPNRLQVFMGEQVSSWSGITPHASLLLDRLRESVRTRRLHILTSGRNPRNLLNAADSVTGNRLRVGRRHAAIKPHISAST
jgi:hypothetical protein